MLALINLGNVMMHNTLVVPKLQQFQVFPLIEFTGAQNLFAIINDLDNNLARKRQVAII